MSNYDLKLVRRLVGQVGVLLIVAGIVEGTLEGGAPTLGMSISIAGVALILLSGFRGGTD